jgi:hypothetical protein
MKMETTLIAENENEEISLASIWNAQTKGSKTGLSIASGKDFTIRNNIVTRIKRLSLYQDNTPLLDYKERPLKPGEKTR